MPSSSRVGAQRVFRGQLLGDLARQRRVEPALHVDAGQFVQLILGLGGEFGSLAGEVGFLRVLLRADGDVLAGGHGHRAGHQPGHAGNQYLRAPGAGRGDADDEAGRRHDAVIGAQHGGAQPADALGAVFFAVGSWHGWDPLGSSSSEGWMCSAISVGRAATRCRRGDPGTFTSLYPRRGWLEEKWRRRGEGRGGELELSMVNGQIVNCQWSTVNGRGARGEGRGARGGGRGRSCPHAEARARTPGGYRGTRSPSRRRARGAARGCCLPAGRAGSRLRLPAWRCAPGRAASAACAPGRRQAWCRIAACSRPC